MIIAIDNPQRVSQKYSALENPVTNSASIGAVNIKIEVPNRPPNIQQKASTPRVDKGFLRAK
jgi:hypothetical protein